MSRATSPWPRERHLLLLVPLLWAGSASAQLLNHLEIHWAPLPPTATAGTPAQFTVVAINNLTGLPDTSYRGTVSFASTDPEAALPPDTFFTSADEGKKTFSITFKLAGARKGVSVRDVGNPLLTAERTDITVEPGPTRSFELSSLPTMAYAGQSFSTTLVTKDAYENLSRYGGTLVFTSSDPRATFSMGAAGALTVTFGTTGAHSFTLADSVDTTLRAESASIPVAPGVFDHYTLSSPRPRTGTCTLARIDIAAVDEFGNAVTVFPRDYTLCATRSHSANLVTLPESSPATKDGDCFRGTLRADGTGSLFLENPVAEGVLFMIEGTPSPSEIGLAWLAGMISPERSSFLWSDGSNSVRELKAPLGTLGLKLQLRDHCGELTDPPLDKPLGFAADPPLVLDAPIREDDGQYVVSLRLPECPTTGEALLAVWPTLGGLQVIRPGTTTRVQRQVQPKCLTTAAELSVRPEQEGAVAGPGELVDFLVEIENKGELAIRDGVIHVSVNGMTVLEAKLDGVALAASAGGFVLPKLEIGAKLTVKVKAQVTAKLDQPATATVWYATSGGTPLTPEKVVSFDMEGGLGVDVGCGCHAGDLPSQLLPLLALLLVGSRPRERWRRLARGERTDR
jgi:hypothetical protein